MDKSKQMSSIMNRLIELTGWIVLVISVILLGIANHIDNYQPPEPTARAHGFRPEEVSVR
ncbi:TPA: division septum protein Blr [Salmonella enterica]|uniref:Division septum protein Blr n=3 Tax=Salmonella enterica TaxID=28901 RepID=A0A764RW03_SALER|nr:division septum protein Blr [Salmonella enterica]